jgi:predicted nucleic acid-binding protein
MTIALTRVFFDTNVYIIGAADPNTYESRLLQWVGFVEEELSSVEVVVSQELFDQILRVAKRLKNKDWGGELLGRIWQNLNVCYVLLDADEFSRVEALGIIPREDVGVYLTAKNGKAKCFVSANHELIRALAKQTGEFECLTPEEFASKYLG